MQRDDAIAMADKAATSVFGFAKGPKAFRWHELLEAEPAMLAKFIDAHGEVSAPAEALYIHARTEARQPFKPWSEAGAALRCALETFRATYLVLGRMVEVPRPKANGARTRTGLEQIGGDDDMLPGMDERI